MPNTANDGRIKEFAKETFFDIAEVTDDTRLASNIYAYFFDCAESHRLKNLLFTTFLELINTKSVKKIHYEGGRIRSRRNKIIKQGNWQGKADILITTGDIAIVIKNQITQQLDIDLKEYLAALEAEQKKIVVLTLELFKDSASKKLLANNDAINISHNELLEKYLVNIETHPELKKNCPSNIFAYLHEFVQNIHWLSYKPRLADIQLYYENIKADKIGTDIVKFINSYFANLLPKQLTHRLSVLPYTLIPLGDRILERRGYLYYYPSNLALQNDDLVLVIELDFDKVSPLIQLRIELDGELAHKKDELKNIFLKKYNQQFASTVKYKPRKADKHEGRDCSCLVNCPGQLETSHGDILDGIIEQAEPFVELIKAVDACRDRK